jgi:uncharacterized membrane protein YciS (DUF1049 family)
MKSYFLGTLTVMGLTAIYVTNNAADINVSFIRLQGTFHQGLWEMGLFIAGVVISSLFSAGASVEMYIANRKKTRELSKRIEELEDEKKALLGALNNIGAKPLPAVAPAPAIVSSPDAAAEPTAPDPEPKADAPDPSPARPQPFIKGFLSSIF